MEKLKYTNLEHVVPEVVDVDSKAIKEFLDEIIAKKLGLQSFTIVRHNKVCAQGFFAPYAKEYPHVLYSMSKSLTSTAVGLAIGDGLLKLDDKVSDFFPEYRSAKRLMNKALTVRTLLTMRSDKLITFLENKDHHDWVKQYFDAGFMLPPDTKFNYISENTFMLSAIVSKVTGKSMLDYLDEKMFTPLGIEKPFWEADGKGNNAGGWGCYMKSEDLAKFFLPYIHEGKWIDDTQLIPKFWVEEALTKQTDTVHDGANDIINGYGFQFWKNPVPNSFRADGLFGQRCFMFPDYDALVVLNCGEAEDYKVMEVFWKYFPKCFKVGEHLNKDDNAVKELNETIASLSMPILEAKPRNKEIEDKIDGKILACSTNDFTSVITVSITQMLYNRTGKISEMKFHFNENSLSFMWKEKNFVNTIEAGMNGEILMSEIDLGDLHYHAYSQASWQEDGSLKLWIRPVETAHVRQFTFYFNEDKSVKIINEMTPRFQDLVVYYLNFMGMPLKTKPGEDGIKKIVHDLGLPIIEPDFRGKFID